MDGLGHQTATGSTPCRRPFGRVPWSGVLRRSLCEGPPIIETLFSLACETGSGWNRLTSQGWWVAADECLEQGGEAMPPSDGRLGVLPISKGREGGKELARRTPDGSAT